VQSLEEGQVIEGVVKNITDYGAFVDLGGIDGLLHVTDIAWRRINHPSEVLVHRPDRQGPDHPRQPGNAPHLAGHEAA
jgi:polyribonucleotide nucleotidyltransferase